MASRPSSGLRGGSPAPTPPAAGDALARLEQAFLVILEAARNDPDLAERLANALAGGVARQKRGASRSRGPKTASVPSAEPALRAGQTRPPGPPPAPARRAPAVLDPYAIYEVGWEAMLRERLEALDLEQIKDIVAEHTMDPTGQALRWTELERVVELIVQAVIDRSEKTV